MTAARHATRAVLLALGLALFALPALAATSRIERTLPLAPDGSLRLSTANGDVHVEAWDRDEVHLVAEIRGRNREQFERTRIEIESSPLHVDVRTKTSKEKRSWWSWLWNGGDDQAQVDFVVRVPRGATLDGVSSVNGQVVIAGVQGPLDLDNVNGDIRVRGARGSVKACTVNGSIALAFDSLEGVGRIDAETVNGGVRLGLPPEPSYDVTVSSVNGRVHDEFNGRSRPGYRSSHYRVGDGRVRIDVDTVNGSVHLMQAAALAAAR